MKKIIALLLAMVMLFSVATVAFAEDAADTTTTQVADDSTTVEGEETTEEEPLLGEYDWILDLPFWTVGPAFKLAKIALKLVKVFFKLALVFGIIDSEAVMDQVIGAIVDLIESSQQGAEGETTEPTTAPPETTVSAAA